MTDDATNPSFLKFVPGHLEPSAMTVEDAAKNVSLLHGSSSLDPDKVHPIWP